MLRLGSWRPSFLLFTSLYVVCGFRSSVRQDATNQTSDSSSSWITNSTHPWSSQTTYIKFLGKGSFGSVSLLQTRNGRYLAMKEQVVNGNRDMIENEYKLQAMAARVCPLSVGLITYTWMSKDEGWFTNNYVPKSYALLEYGAAGSLESWLQKHRFHQGIHMVDHGRLAQLIFAQIINGASSEEHPQNRHRPRGPEARKFHRDDGSLCGLKADALQSAECGQRGTVHQFSKVDRQLLRSEDCRLRARMPARKNLHGSSTRDATVHGA
eukprot:TRINITY_DN9844_c0_g1_i1.p1 TRINITY_DN9844_c0_g1~~TRINITY_DN9844_c0_g1_i1.p1  ORF type:complete len:286 (-),score=10.24 TRINITY_DN9844_c0_g1_i1:605-1405(-)